MLGSKDRYIKFWLIDTHKVVKVEMLVVTYPTTVEVHSKASPTTWITFKEWALMPSGFHQLLTTGPMDTMDIGQKTGTKSMSTSVPKMTSRILCLQLNPKAFTWWLTLLGIMLLQSQMMTGARLIHSTKLSITIHTALSRISTTSLKLRIADLLDSQIWNKKMTGSSIHSVTGLKT